MAGAIEGDNFIGNSAQQNRGFLKLKYPIEHGVITNWDDMTLIWQSVFNNDLRTSTEDHPVLLTEAPLNPRVNREKCAQIFFETFNTPALYLSIQAILALYSLGKTTGVVLDSGDGVSHVVPVYEGFSLPNSIKRIDIAGRDITEQLQLLLRKSGYIFQTSAEKEVVRIIKEKMTYVSKDPKRDEKEWLTFTSLNQSVATTSGASSAAAAAAAAAAAGGGGTSAGDSDIPRNTSFQLPDGKIIQLGPETFRAPEILFNPEIIGSEFSGLPDLVHESIRKNDLDLRDTLYKNIVLSGGTTLTRGFGDRLLLELRKLEPKTKIKIYAPPERKYSTWIGGSILAGLSTFKRMWISYAEWQENPDIIHTKCL